MEYVYKCNHCGGTFPHHDLLIVEEHGCYESDYGVGDLFSDHHYYTEEFGACPICGEREDYNSGALCEECGEFVEEFCLGNENHIVCDDCRGKYTEEEYLEKYSCI